MLILPWCFLILFPCQSQGRRAAGEEERTDHAKIASHLNPAPTCSHSRPRTGSSVSELETAQTQLGPACAVSVLLSEREHSFELASKGLPVSCPTPHTLGIALSENSKLCEGRRFKEGSFKEGAPYKRKSRGC